jgi:hypothetical protein
MALLAIVWVVMIPVTTAVLMHAFAESFFNDGRARRREPDMVDRTVFGALCLLAAVVWPLVLPAVVLGYMTKLEDIDR